MSAFVGQQLAILVERAVETRFEEIGGLRVGGWNDSALSGPILGRIRMKKARIRAPIPGFAYFSCHSLR